ncbi:hypothetical protein BDR07DRAFT_1616034 [Suillus spraguei]|nr:hypothetical protein BDR07DRAFT_1616034 [Suillus spraguei]
MKLSLLFSMLASIVVLATAYPTEGATGIAKRSNAEKREELDTDHHIGYKKYTKRNEWKRDSGEIDVLDNDYDFKNYKRDEGKRDSGEIDVLDNDYDFEKYKRDEGKRDSGKLTSSTTTMTSKNTKGMRETQLGGN